MKRLTQIFQALLGVVALIFTAIIALGRLVWRTISKVWYKLSKWFRCLFLLLLTLLFVGGVSLTLYSAYQEKYGHWQWYDENLSENVEMHYYRSNHYRVYNTITRQYTTPKIDWIVYESDTDSLAVYAHDGKRGYINIKTGNIVIDAAKHDYEKAWVFSEGLAAVMKDGKIGFINSNNEVVIPFQYDYSDTSHFCDIGYLFHQGYCVMTNALGQMGVIDTAGNWAVEPIYGQVWVPHKSGYRVVIKDGKYGVLDSLCRVVYPLEYEWINIVNEGFILSQEGRMWQVDFNGNITQPFLIDDTRYLYYPASCISEEDYVELTKELSDYALYQVVGKYGILNRITGQHITPAIYSHVKMLSKDLFKVCEHDKIEWYLIDTNGVVVN